ncbi:MAG: MBL fold metallo-hydrolase RNA specificity domain-containing protein [Candidatus Sumerlaeaceae bacterium]
MKLKFWGAARTVTGSSHLLTVGDKNIMLDCGLFQGNRKLGNVLNREFAIAPPLLDALVLSHTHIDHCGNIPNLVRNGYAHPVHCTSATADLAAILMRDSAHIQEQDARFLNKKLSRQGELPIEPLYTADDAERTIPLLKPHAYGSEVEVLPNTITIRYKDAGHVLGSAFVETELQEAGRNVKLTFSADIGRRNMPILKDPETASPAEYLILESTYGDRLHQEYVIAEAQLAEAATRVIARGGKIIIPAFSVGRTQEIVYAMNRLWNAGKMPRVPVYVDSPLSTNATGVFRAHPECFDEYVLRDMKADADPFGFEGLLYTQNVDESKRINLLNAPCVIISASGMAESGRILHHLRNNIGDPRNAVFIVGFQAENTLGRRIVEKQPEVKIFGEVHKLNAEVVTFNAFSAHGDRDELRMFARQAASAGTLRKIFLVHGEEKAMLTLREFLMQDLPGVEVLTPARGEVYEL